MAYLASAFADPNRAINNLMAPLELVSSALNYGEDSAWAGRPKFSPARYIAKRKDREDLLKRGTVLGPSMLDSCNLCFHRPQADLLTQRRGQLVSSPGFSAGYQIYLPDAL